MGSSVTYTLSQEELSKIVAISVKEGVKAFREEQAKEDRKRAKSEDKVKKTKKMLSSYRRMKATLSDEAEFTEAEKIELRWKFIEDLMGNFTEGTARSESVAIN